MNKKRILVVENERIVALDIKHTLISLDYEVAGIIARGEEAIIKAGEEKPDCILMDIRLDGEIDGVQAAQEIKNKYDIPIIFLSAFSDDPTVQRAKISEPYGYLVKPFAGKDLKTIIEMALYKHQMERKLKSMEKWLSTTLRSIGDAVITTDISRIVTFMNPSAEDMTGIKQEEFIGKDLFSLIGFAEENSGLKIEDTVKKVLVSGKTEQIYNSHLVVGNTVGPPITISISPLANESNIVTGAVYVLRDITPLKRAQEESMQTMERLRSSMNAMICAMEQTVETRDPYTAGHQRRVTNLARTIATEMGMPPEVTDGIRMAGVIHDMGKISVPAEILSKPGKLIEAEVKLIQTHPETGYNILKNIEFPWPVADIVHQHHERIDGSGYPGGLMGNTILLEARILSVADVVEAMASHRPYRPALGVEMSLAEVKSNRGILYDPNAVDACIAVFNDGFAF